MFITLLKKISAVVTLFSIFSISLPALTPVKLGSQEESEVSSFVLPKGSCDSTNQDPIAKLSTLGRRTDSRLLPVIKSNASGLPVEFVSSGTGDLSFSVRDIKNAGASQFAFQRFYSNSNENIGLGKGWTFDFSDRIIVRGNEATLINRSGEKTNFVAATVDSKERIFVPKESQGLLSQGFKFLDDTSIIQNSDGTEKTYQKFGNEFFLTKVKMSDFKKANISRFVDGRVSKISEGSDSITFNWSSQSNPKILSINDNKGRQVVFSQIDGFLTKVTKFSGEFEKYQYRNGKLESARDQSKSLLLNVKYDAEGRVSQTKDEIHSVNYGYDWSQTAKVMKIATSEGYTAFYDHSTNGFIRRVYDFQGTLANFKYDSRNLLTEVSNDKQVALSLSYNNEGKLIKTEVPNNDNKTIEYDSNGKIISTQVNGTKTNFSYNSNGVLKSQSSIQDGKEINTTLDDSGRVAFVKVAEKQTQFEYDNEGNVIASNLPDKGRYEASYNPLGQKISERLPEGKVVSYEYNASEKPVKITDSAGYKLIAQYDASNRLSKVFNDKGWLRVERDKVGRIILTENSNGQKREFRYNSYGALKWYRTPKNVEYQLTYTSRGKLKEITNSQGLKTEFNLDQNGNAIVDKKYLKGKEIQQNSTTNNSFSSLFDDCGFGFYDWWDMPLAYGIDIAIDGCGEGGGFGGGLGGGGFDGGSGGFSSGDCEACKQEQRDACWSYKAACISVAGGALTAAYALCFLSALVPPALIVCYAAASAVYAAALAGCNFTYNGCMSEVNTKCALRCR